MNASIRPLRRPPTAPPTAPFAPRRHQAVLGALLLSLAGCDRYDPDGVWIRSDCEEQRVARLVPSDGEVSVYVGGWVLGQVACSAPEATLELTTQSGQAVAGELTRHREYRQLRLRPDQPLVSNARYTALMETDDGNREWSFTTSSTGTAVGDDVADLSGAALASQGALLDPAAGLEPLDVEFDALKLALRLLSDADSGPNGLRLGAWSGDAADGVQDASRPTVDLGLEWADPHFSTEPSDLRLRLANLPLVLEDAVLGGGVRPGGGALDGLWLQGRWDTREAMPALGDLCAADLEELGEGCGPCRDGVEACLPFLLVHVPVAAWPGDLLPLN